MQNIKMLYIYIDPLAKCSFRRSAIPPGNHSPRQQAPLPAVLFVPQAVYHGVSVGAERGDMPKVTKYICDRDKILTSQILEASDWLLWKTMFWIQCSFGMIRQGTSYVVRASNCNCEHI